MRVLSTRLDIVSSYSVGRMLVHCTDESRFSPSLDPLIHSSVGMPFNELKFKILLNAGFEIFST